MLRCTVCRLRSCRKAVVILRFHAMLLRMFFSHGVLTLGFGWEFCREGSLYISANDWSPQDIRPFAEERKTAQHFALFLPRSSHTYCYPLLFEISY